MSHLTWAGLMSEDCCPMSNVHGWINVRRVGVGDKYAEGNLNVRELCLHCVCLLMSSLCDVWRDV